MTSFRGVFFVFQAKFWTELLLNAAQSSKGPFMARFTALLDAAESEAAAPDYGAIKEALVAEYGQPTFESYRETVRQLRHHFRTILRAF